MLSLPAAYEREATRGQREYHSTRGLCLSCLAGGPPGQCPPALSGVVLQLGERGQRVRDDVVHGQGNVHLDAAFVGF